MSDALEEGLRIEREARQREVEADADPMAEDLGRAINSYVEAHGNVQITLGAVIEVTAHAWRLATDRARAAARVAGRTGTTTLRRRPCATGYVQDGVYHPHVHGPGCDLPEGER